MAKDWSRGAPVDRPAGRTGAEAGSEEDESAGSAPAGRPPVAPPAAPAGRPPVAPPAANHPSHPVADRPAALGADRPPVPTGDLTPGQGAETGARIPPRPAPGRDRPPAVRRLLRALAPFTLRLLLIELAAVAVFAIAVAVLTSSGGGVGPERAVTRTRPVPPVIIRVTATTPSRRRVARVSCERRRDRGCGRGAARAGSR